MNGAHSAPLPLRPPAACGCWEHVRPHPHLQHQLGSGSHWAGGAAIAGPVQASCFRGAVHGAPPRPGRRYPHVPSNAWAMSLTSISTRVASRGAPRLRSAARPPPRLSRPRGLASLLLGPDLAVQRFITNTCIVPQPTQPLGAPTRRSPTPRPAPPRGPRPPPSPDRDRREILKEGECSVRRLPVLPGMHPQHAAQRRGARAVGATGCTPALCGGQPVAPAC